MNGQKSLYETIYGGKKRKPFLMSTKKRVWMKARGSNPNDWRTGFIKTSYCMNPRCKKKLNWDKRWEFEVDHRDNNSSNNRESNCFIVCLSCHRKHTVIKKRAIYSLGVKIGNETIKKKSGYKKTTKKKTMKKKRTRRTQDNILYSGKPIRIGGDWY